MFKKIIYYGLIGITIVVVVATFVTTKTYTQLAIASVLYALFVYFVFEAMAHKNKPHVARVSASRIYPVVMEPEKAEETVGGVDDFDKRAFLKLIGITGFSLFVFSLFNKRAEAAFLGSAGSDGTTFIKDSEGNKINPAEKHPTDGYKIAELDDNDITYYGFTNKDGAWFIMKEDTESGSFRYVKGSTNFPIYWNIRTKLKYDYYNNTF